MTVTAHNVLILSLVAVCLALVWRLLNCHRTNLGHDLLLIILLGGILVIVNLLSAATYDGSQFGMIQLVAWSVLATGIVLGGGGSPRIRSLCRPELVIVDLVPE